MTNPEQDSWLMGQGIETWVSEGLIDKIWRELEGRVSHDRIREAAQECAAEFEGAKVSLFIPVLLHRRTREKLADWDGR